MSGPTASTGIATVRRGRRARNCRTIGPWGKSGFRLDWDASSVDLITLQGDLYQDRIDVTPTADVEVNGRNLMGRWSRRLSDLSDLKVQVYVDRVHRMVPGSYDDVLNTYDVDAQHRILLGGRHDVVWGVGYRRVEDDFGCDRAGVRPASRCRSRRSAASHRTRLP